MAYKSKQIGFTVVKLMVAIAIYSVAMLLITMGVIFVGRQYQQASTRVKLENASREIHQQVGQSVQFAAQDPINSTASGGWISTCIGAQRYTYADLAASASPSYTTTTYDNLKKGLYLDTIVPITGGCNILNNPDTSSSATNLLPGSSVVTQLYFNSGQLTTKFVSADSDLLNLSSSAVSSDAIQCKSGIAGREYCAVVQLVSTATKRITN